MADRLSFDDFMATLADLGGTVVISDDVRETIEQAAGAIESLPDVTRESLAALIEQHPSWVPVLGACVRLSQEALKNQLRHRIGTSAWVQVARTDPMRIIAALDEGFDLVGEIRAQRDQLWTFTDILVERYSSRSRAGGAILRGRTLEDEVETVAAELGLSRVMRTRFIGRSGRLAPCDIAIPAGGDQALIVGSAKGFNSTGSKLSDAVREVEEMADVRLPRQFVFAFVDGIGWLSRVNDLRRIYRLWESQSIDGLYSLARMGEFRQDLRDAAIRLGLLAA
jgi:hypothetical protein